MMASYEAFYAGSEGSSYPFEKPYGGFTGPGAYHASVSDIAYPTDPLTANQLKKVSDKISTGAKTIEVSGLGLMGGGPMKHLASIPRQHWKEIDRLRKLTGVDLTFHGPLVESTGFSRGNWSEDQRVEAQKQMEASVELAQQMNSEDKTKGVVMTFHTNNGLPEVKRRVVVGRNEDGSPKEEVVQMALINERTGRIVNLPTPHQDYFEHGEDRKIHDMKEVERKLKKLNEEEWKRQIETVFINNTRVNRELIETLSSTKKIDDSIKEMAPGSKTGIFEAYKLYDKDYDSYSKGIEKLRQTNPSGASLINQGVSNLHNAAFFIQESYDQLKELYNEAFEKAEKDNRKVAKDKLESYRVGLVASMERFKKDKSNFVELQEKITQGTKLLRDPDIQPEIYRPLEKFAIDKGSDTFSGVALHAWRNAKKQGLAPGIISIENPPAGMSGLTSADELKELIKQSRSKFIDKAVKSEKEGGAGMSREQAENVSKQIIGATWDVGHINSIQKWGYNRKDVLNEAKTIAPFVKHMHIADNLGFEDAELPAGMGNVPIDEILNNKEWGHNFQKVKKAIETGDWFSRQGGMGMSYTPVREAFSGLTAPVYGASMGDAGAAYWNSAIMNEGTYFGGLGPINPEIHHSIYGGGFSGLPAYSGGELPGKAANSSFSGAPLE